MIGRMQQRTSFGGEGRKLTCFDAVVIVGRVSNLRMLGVWCSVAHALCR